MSLVLSLSIQNLVPWTTSAAVPTASFSAPITSYSVVQVLETIGPKGTTRVKSSLNLLSTQSEKRLRHVNALMVSKLWLQLVEAQEVV